MSVGELGSSGPTDIGQNDSGSTGTDSRFGVTVFFIGSVEPGVGGTDCDIGSADSFIRLVESGVGVVDWCFGIVSTEGSTDSGMGDSGGSVFSSAESSAGSDSGFDSTDSGIGVADALMTDKIDDSEIDHTA